MPAHGERGEGGEGRRHQKQLQERRSSSGKRTAVMGERTVGGGGIGIERRREREGGVSE